MRDLQETGRPVDMITLVEELDRRKEVEAIGGVAYLSSLIDGVPERPSIEHYVRIVRNKALLRGLINVAQNAIAEAIEHTDEAEEVAGTRPSRPSSSSPRTAWSRASSTSLTSSKPHSARWKSCTRAARRSPDWRRTTRCSTS